VLEAQVRRRQQRSGLFLALPAIIWLGLFFLLPLGIVGVYSFLTRDAAGSVALPFTLEHYERTFGVFSVVLWRSVWISVLSTIICLLIGYPLAFFIATRRNNWVRQLCLFMVVLPFWTNFLVRTYAWRILLGDQGTINAVLQSLGLIDAPLTLLNTPFAVVLGLVYGFLPFMVLPIYASVDRFDFKFVDAAHDLGANDIKTFFRVVLPMTLPGVFAGSALVFIPCVGAFVTPDLLGGTQGLMIGNLISRQFGQSLNLPLGSALSVTMMMIVMLALLAYVRLGNRRIGG